MKEPIYKLKDIIENIHGHKGIIFKLYYCNISKEWIYYIKNNLYQASIKESNIKKQKNGII